MTNKNHSELIGILDASGSMANIISDAIGGVNALLRKHRELPGTMGVTLVTFSDVVRIQADNQDIKEVKDLTPETYFPAGSTALFDAIGQTINRVGRRLAETPEDQRPSKVMVLVVTDGMENASREFSRNQIREMTKLQTDKYQWEFVYMGANQDGFAEGLNLGIRVGSTYTASSIGTRSAYDTYTASSADFRMGETSCVDMPKVIPEGTADDSAGST